MIYRPRMLLRDIPKERVCTGCKIVKPAREFYVLKGGRGRPMLSCRCRQCESDRHAGKRLTREQLNRNCLAQKARQRETRIQALLHYSKDRIARCACCGEHRMEFLTLDHILGDGAKHRRENHISYLPLWLRRNKWPDGFQVLCHNCNYAKGTSPKCPHHKWTKVMIHKFVDIHGSVEIGTGTTIWNGVVICADVKIGKDCCVGSSCFIGKGSSLGHGTRLQTNVFLPPNSRLGNGVFIGPLAVFTDDRHPRSGNKHYRAEPPVVEDNASIGAGAVILPGVRIGNGAMVGAGAVVTHDVEPYETVVGCPAEQIKLKEVG